MKKILALGVVTLFITGCTGSSKPVAYIQNGCALDSLSGSGTLSPVTYVTRKGDTLEAKGWLAEIGLGKVPERAALVLVSDAHGIFKAAEEKAGKDRPDVAAAFNKPTLTKSGFAMKFDIKAIPTGTYKIQLVGEYDTFTQVCLSNKEVQVTD